MRTYNITKTGRSLSVSFIAIAAMVGQLQAGPAVSPDTHVPAAAATHDAAKPAGGSAADIAKQATNPVAPLIQLQLQNVFIPDSIEASRYANQFIIQPVIPISKKGFLPRSILRPTLPIVRTANIDDGPDGKTGLGDLSWVYVFAMDQEWGVFGIGGAGAIPTATDPLLGARKWTLGPSVFVLYTKIPKIQIGGLAFNTFSLGGAGQNDVNKLSIQPIFNYHFAPGWYAGLGDMALTFDWENSGDTYLPLSFRVGKVFSIGKQHVNLFGHFHYNVGDDIPGQDQWGFKLSLTLLFPK